jgi:hypothetical protein
VVGLLREGELGRIRKVPLVKYSLSKNLLAEGRTIISVTRNRQIPGRACKQPLIHHYFVVVECIMRIDVHLAHTLQNTKTHSLGLVWLILYLARDQIFRRRLLVPQFPRPTVLLWVRTSLPPLPPLITLLAHPLR